MHANHGRAHAEAIDELAVFVLVFALRASREWGGDREGGSAAEARGRDGEGIGFFAEVVEEAVEGAGVGVGRVARARDAPRCIRRN